MRLHFLGGISGIKITEFLTCVTLNHTKEKELASFYNSNTIERNKIVCGVLMRIFDCSDTSRCT